MNTNTTDHTARKRPVFFVASILATAAIMPTVSLLARFGLGDRHNLGPTLIVFFGGVIASLICVTAGFVRGEWPRWLAIIAVLLLATIVMRLLGFPLSPFAF